MTATLAIPGYSTLLERGDGTDYRAIAEVHQLSGPMLDRTMIETTHMESPDAWREFIGGLLVASDLTLDVNYIPTAGSQIQFINDLKQAVAASANNPWRIVWPDFGRTSVAVDNVNTGTDLVTTAAAHGWKTGQIVKFTTTGTLPAPLVVGRIYYIFKNAADSFYLATSAENAYTSVYIDLTTSGTGTHTALGTSWWEFRAIPKHFMPRAPIDDRLSAEMVLQVTASNVSKP